jgi:hypothetical protein
MPNREHFPTVFARLMPILRAYAPPLRVLEDGAAGFAVHAAPSLAYPDGFSVSGVRIQKRYVSFYFMLVYLFPDLLVGISPQLQQRMQGKACFNFTSPDDALLADLTRLVAAGIARYRQRPLE